MISHHFLKFVHISTHSFFWFYKLVMYTFFGHGVPSFAELSKN